MKKAAVEAAYRSIAKAEGCLRAMQTATNYPAFQAAWSDFLLAARRVYSKLEQGSKANGKSVGWFGRQKHERRTDPLLAYIHHARNVDEHGIEEITEHKRGGVGIRSTGQTLVHQLVIGPGRIEAKADGDPLLITITPDSARLIPVVDRGDTYHPPNAHQGSPISNQSPSAVAELAVTYLRSMVSEAAKLPP